MINDPKRLRFAIPKKGRLQEPTIELLQKSGFNFRAKDRNLYATCTNEDIVFIFVRADDIPVLVENGVVDIGITGNDLVGENRSEVSEILKLGYGKCRLCVAVRDDNPMTGIKALEGKTIATSFPETTSDYFRKNGVNVSVIEMNGSVEIMVALGLADAIVDIVETGDSLRDNNLRIFSDIGTYETVLVANSKISRDNRVDQIKRRIEGVLTSRKYSILEYNIPESSLKNAELITPGYKSPTISKLDIEGWVGVKVMVEKGSVNKVMDQLEKIGATAIYETSINNCRL
jgi:ATP phosphoribosyltransferase